MGLQPLVASVTRNGWTALAITPNASILHEMEKAELSAQLTAMAPRVGSDPAIYERFKTLSARFAQLKSLPS